MYVCTHNTSPVEGTPVVLDTRTKNDKSSRSLQLLAIIISDSIICLTNKHRPKFYLA